MSEPLSQPGLASLSKSFEPAAIESRWGPAWEQAGLGRAGFRGSGQPDAGAAARGENFAIQLPPPNVTGTLHMGHAFNQTIMDSLTRYHRMRGFNTVWVPGTDHAGIATQIVVERQLQEQGQSRHDLGRKNFVARVWDWKQQSGNTITQQMRRMGDTVDWSREYFTMDDKLSKVVTETFVQLYEQGLIYRGKRLVNWDPELKTAVSDLEVESEEEDGFLWHIAYPLADGSDDKLVVATTRPETMLGDVAVMVHPADERYQRPIVTREFNSSWQMYDRHLYPGGACRLHTLCCELGDDSFWQGVRAYLARYRGEVVETDDFRRVLEEVSGRSLGRFFDQWFYSPGYPAIKVRFKHDAARGEGRFTIEQTQADAQTGERAFHLHTELGWVVDGKLQLWPITLESARQTVVIPMPAAPDQVRFDPRGLVLHKLDLDPGQIMLRRQLTAAGDVTGRIQAGLALAAKGSREGIAAIRAACSTEPFWGVRVEWMEALGKAGVDAALEALVERCLLEQDPRVLASVMRAIGRYRDPLMLEAVQARLAQDDLPYTARAAALEALGAGRAEAPVDLLLEAAGREGFGGIVQAGAFRALAASRLPEALTGLEEYVGYGASSNRSRPAAVAALAELGHRQERAARERVTDTLVDLLRDPNQKVAWAAARGLGILEAASAIPALEAFAAPRCRQEQVAVARLTADIRAAGSSKPGGKADEMESLRSQLRKVMDRVEKLEARLKVPGAVVDDGVAEASG